jgi:anti-sigma regulatory factor (Ser/Thr protein kinase)
MVASGLDCGNLGDHEHVQAPSPTPPGKEAMIIERYGWRGPGWQVFDPDLRCAGWARRWITSVIARHDCPVDRDDAAVCIGELVANALEHGPAEGRVLVGYCLWREGARLVVCDGGGPGTPRLLGVREHAEDGRGLHVVDSLTARWGSFRISRVRVVWCDLGEPLHAAHSDAWAWLHLVLSMGSLCGPERPACAAIAGTLAAAGAR